MVLWCITAVILIGIDQLTKFLIVNNFELYESINIIPELFNFTYVQNTGAAFSILKEHTWILSILSVAFCIGLLIFMFLKKPKSKFLRICLVMIFAGAFGNAIDRLFLGYVVDFIETAFMDFPVFNFADILITVGAVLLIVFELFFEREETKEKE